MRREEIEAAVLEEIGNIAPEADLDTLGRAEDIREVLDMDSMDVMNLVIALHKRLDVEIPDAEAGRFVTVDGAAEYLSGQLQADKPCAE
ncbi:MAG: acyl carrier protein [bacterium]